MSRTQKFLKNTVTTALLQVVTMLSGFIIPKVMLSVYGSEINGLVTSISQFISYLTLVEAGLSGATVYSLYRPIANRDIDAVNRVLSAARNFYYGTGYIFLGLVSGLGLLYPMLVKTQELSYHEVVFLFFILGVNGVLEFFTLAKYRVLLTADQRTYVISLASIVQTIIHVSVIAILPYYGASIVFVRFIAISAILIRTVILWAYCRRKYRFLDFSAEPDYSSMDKRWDALYFQIIGVIHNGAPVMIATFFLSLHDVSVYSIYAMVIIGINSILSIFTSGLAASFGDLIARGEKDGFRRAFRQFEYVFYMILTSVYAITMVTYSPFIRVYTLGADINYSYPVLAILMTINGYLYNLKTPYGMLTISAGKYRESRFQITIQGLLEIVCGSILSLVWGIKGIVVGSIISNLYRDINFIFFAPKHLTHYSFLPSLMLWLRSLGTGILVVIIARYIPTGFVNDYKSWFAYASIVGVISVMITLSVNIALDLSLFKEVCRQIRSVLAVQKAKRDS